MALTDIERLSIMGKTDSWGKIKRKFRKWGFSFGLLYMDTPVLADQQKLALFSSVRDTGWSLRECIKLSLWHYAGCPTSRRFLCLFWRETRQRVWTRDLDATGSRKRTPVRELEEGTQRRQLAKGDASGQSNTRAEVTGRHERESRVSEGRPVKMSQHSS